ncbi:MAG: MATE family efflux transporter [Oscillospiraceae bacterium]|nr:MATE family efflux transporter [Oscillospiraceae bacterium]
MLKQYIGDRAFYSRVMKIAIPMIIQNGITNFVSLLDNIMVGQVGTIPMSGVSVVNGLLFVFNLCVFGACSGAGIFTAQFHGSGDEEGIRHTVRFKLLVCGALAAIGITVFLAFGSPLIRLYLQGEGSAADAEGVLHYGLDYLKVMLIGLIPFAICNAYAGTLRETGQTTVPMLGGIVAVLINLVLNYVLIFGHFGAPAMGVRGAALATVISRFAELLIVAGWVHRHAHRNGYIRGVFRSLRIPLPLLKSIFRKGMPLLVNEFLWATGIAILNQCYSTCGLEVVPAMNIATTIHNLGSVFFLSTGNAVGILMGQMLGAGTPEAEIRASNRKLMATSVAIGTVVSVIMLGISGLFPGLYNTTENVRVLAGQLICVSAVMMPFNAFTNATYFTLRSGGQTLVTFLFDSCFVWCCCIPVAFCLSRFTPMTIIPLYIICQALDIVKCALGGYMLKKGAWIQNLTV